MVSTSMSGIYQRKMFQAFMGGEEKSCITIGQLLEVYYATHA